MNCLKFLRQKLVNSYLLQTSIRKRYQTIDVTDNGVKYELLDQMDRQFDDIDINTYSELMLGNDNDINNRVKLRIELILSEYEYEKESTLRVPKTLTIGQMKELLDLTQSVERRKLIRFWAKNEYRKALRELNKCRNKRHELTQSTDNKQRMVLWDENNELIYGLGHNTMCQRISKKSVSRLHNHRLRASALFGQKVVIDLDFDKYMKAYESRLLLRQLHFLYNYNKFETKEPFDLHFVNCNPEEISVREMHRYLPNCKTEGRNAFFASMHYNKSYLHVFPKERLVYLSPHSSETLSTVSEDDIYIIGGIIDKSYRAPITKIKAREDGIRSAKLPIDSYVKWSKGSKHLCLNQVIAILHDWKVTKDWEQTLRRHLPQRKIETIIGELEPQMSVKDSKYV